MKKKMILAILCLSMVSALASCGSSDSSDSTAATTEASAAATDEATEADTEEETEKATEKATEAETEEDAEADLDALYEKADYLRRAALSAATDLDASGVEWMWYKSALASSDGCDGITNVEAFESALNRYIDLTGYEYIIIFADPSTVRDVWVAESWDSTDIGVYPDQRPLTVSEKGKTLKEILDSHS